MMSRARSVPAAPIDLAVVSDASYIEPIGVMLHSLLRWHSAAELRLHWVHVNMDRQGLQAARDLCRAAGLRLNLAAGDALLARDGWPASVNPTILKIYLAEILTDIGRLLYLDGDLVVEAALWPLWQTNLHGRTLAGVRDSWVGSPGFWSNMPPSAADYRTLWMRADYINAGVLLYDLERCRTLDVADRCSRWLSANRAAHFFEQDALNVVLAGDLALAPAAWNVLGAAESYLLRPQPRSGYSADELRDAYRNPKIIHFAGSQKPWGRASDWQPLSPRYFRARRSSPWHRPLTPPERLHIALLDLAHRVQCRGQLRAARALLYARDAALQAGSRTRRWRNTGPASC